MGRKILAVIVALIVSFAIILIVEMLNSIVVRPPAVDVMADPDRLRDFMTTLPPIAYVVVLVGYILGAFAGGFIVTKMSRHVSPGITLPLVIGVILEAAAIANLFILLPGQPLWFAVLCLICFIPMSLIGHRFAR